MGVRNECTLNGRTLAWAVSRVGTRLTGDNTIVTGVYRTLARVTEGVDAATVNGTCRVTEINGQRGTYSWQLHCYVSATLLWHVARVWVAVHIVRGLNG